MTKVAKNQHIRVRISDEMRQDIEIASAEERRSISNWIINVLEDRLVQWRKQQAERNGRRPRPAQPEAHAAATRANTSAAR